MNAVATPLVTPLRSLGYSLLPSPRQVSLGAARIRFGAQWGLELSGVDAQDMAMESYQTVLRDEFNLQPAGAPSATGGAAKAVRLSIRPGAVQVEAEPECQEQAYRLNIDSAGVEIVANAPAGLFYGVQTLLQLLEGDGADRLVLPACQIVDWPDLQLRIVHWDTKHHQDRPETLRRFLDESARLKVNAVCFELEDKFEYPSHPQIGAPGAFTTAQLQELTRYARRRHIEMIPNVQAPAHMGYVLKHEQFAHLRCDGSSYMSCMDDPKALALIFDMYRDLIAATPGCKYFHVSTDEVYYAGICEKYRRPYNPENRSLTWLNFVLKAHEFLSGLGRKTIIWAEYPLLAQHVALLPKDIIDGVAAGGDDFARAELQAGLRCFIYSPIQGMELMFPDYFAHAASGRLDAGRLAHLEEAVQRGKATRLRPMATFCGAWGDSGLHNETFWLGWGTSAQFGWSRRGATVGQTIADFFDTFHGRSCQDMTAIYQDLQQQARFYEMSLERVPSRVRGPAYGNSGAKRPINRQDLTLTPPGLPEGPAAARLDFGRAFSAQHAQTLAQLPERLAQSDRLIARLHANLTRVRRNRYNLEVLLSIAQFVRHWLNVLATLGQIENQLAQAGELDRAANPAGAVGQLNGAAAKAQWLIDDLRLTYEQLKGVWEKSHFPKNRSADGRDFLHIMDDVKDHFADRRADLSYLIAPEESVNLPAWRDKLLAIAHAYAAGHGLQVQGPGEKILDD